MMWVWRGFAPNKMLYSGTAKYIYLKLDYGCKYNRLTERNIRLRNRGIVKISCKIRYLATLLVKIRMFAFGWSTATVFHLAIH